MIWFAAAVCFYSSEVATLLSATQKSVRCPPSALSASTYFKSTFNLSIIVHQQPEHTDSQPARPLHQYCAKTHTHTHKQRYAWLISYWSGILWVIHGKILCPTLCTLRMEDRRAQLSRRNASPWFYNIASRAEMKIAVAATRTLLLRFKDRIFLSQLVTLVGLCFLLIH